MGLGPNEQLRRTAQRLLTASDELDGEFGGNALDELRDAREEMTKVLSLQPELSFSEYEQKALRTADLSEPEEVTLSLGAIGLVGEAIEIVEELTPLFQAVMTAKHAKDIGDHIKKHLEQGHPLNIEKLKKEMGDELWYLSRLCKVLGTSLGEVAKLNNEKLEKRFPTGKVNYEDSVARRDEVSPRLSGED